jgi:hypothetical protein
MGILSTIISKVFGGQKESAAPAPAAAAEIIETTVAETTTPPVAEFDVTGYLDGLRAQSQEKLEWQVSIVDLMKLVGMDSSLAARKELAKELGYPNDTADSAKMNIWLHKQVMQQIAQHGGKLPSALVA